MNKITQTTPSVITYVLLLLLLILLSATAVVGMILWQVFEHEKTNDVAANYHGVSSQHIGVIGNEVLTIRNNLHQLSGQHITSSKNQLQINHEIKQSLYVISQIIAQLLNIQKKYQDSNFTIVVDQLESQLDPLLLAINIDFSEKKAEKEKYLSIIGATLLTLNQLNRLHKIANRELAGMTNAEEKIRVKFMLGFLLSIMLIGGYGTRKIFSTIKIILNNQKYIEDSLAREKDLIHTTLISIGDAVVTTDNTGLVTTMNPVAEKLTGWSNSEAKGQSVKDILPIIDASTRESIANPIEKVLSTGRIVYLSNHTTLIAKDGTEYQIADSAAPIRTEDGRILGMVLVFNDVTEQYALRQAASKSKRNLQAIMDNSPAIIYVKDPTGCFTFINHQFEKLFNLQSSEIIGKTRHDIFPKEIADVMNRNDNAALNAGKPLEFMEVAPQNDGLHNYISIKFPLFNETGEAYAVCGISTDITERKKQEEQLHRSQKMDALGKLTGGIAHDYNNLLGIIMGYAEQLNVHLSNDSKLNKYVRDIYNAAERGTKLNKQLLSFSQNRSHDSEVVDINALLREQQLMLEKTLTARIKLVLNLTKDLWPVYLDVSDLENAILNICINAMHAMEFGGELSIGSSNAQLSELDAYKLHIDAGDYVLLSVTDSGCGMHEEIQQKIFDPFYSTKGDLGTGLGLSQVHGFVKRSNGAIKVYSEPEHGTRFVLYFPRSQKLITEAQTPIISEEDKLQGGEIILVVDDEQAIVELVYDILSARGYRVLTANDGRQALSILEKEPVDLMVSDVIMPIMDGYQLAAKVQQHYPHIKIQMVSGFADNRHFGVVDEALHKNILYKPYTSKSLLECVRELLDGSAEKTKLSGRTIMIMDDDEDVRTLFSINLAKLGCKTILACDGEQAITYYKRSLEGGESIDAIIMDLSIPGGMGGKEVASKILDIDPHSKLVVASGHSHGREMTHYNEYGFLGALEKNFDSENIKLVLEQVLSSNQRTTKLTQ